MRDLYLRIDDDEENTLIFGHSKEFPLPAGKHKLTITNRLFSKSAEFEIGNEDTVRFSAINVWLGGIFAPISVIAGTGPYKVELKKLS